MARLRLFLIGVVAFSFSEGAGAEDVPTSVPDPGPQAASGVDGWHRGKPQPIHFIENCGQWDDRALFAARFGGGAARIERDGIVLSTTEGDRVKLRFEGVREAPALNARDEVPATYSFFTGKSPDSWRGRVSAYRAVRLLGIYEGVDLELREGEPPGTIEYDLHVADPACLERIVVDCEGARSLAVEEDGSLRMETEHGVLRQSPPRTWQILPSGETRPVRCGYRLFGSGRFGFEADGSDPMLPMVIDPEIQWLSFTGMSGSELAFAVKVAANGEVFMAGRTDSLDFTVPPEGCVNVVGDSPGGNNALILRLDPSGEVLSAAILGGAMDEDAISLSVDPERGVSVCGYTSSDDFPSTNGTSYAGGSGGFAFPGDGFVARLSLDLCELQYSTFLGGSGGDCLNEIDVNARGEIVVLGYTSSRDFGITPGAFQETYRGGSYDATLSVLDPSRGPGLAEQLRYSTYLGSSGSDAWDGTTDPWNDLNVRVLTGGLALDSQGRAAICGFTNSSGFPTTEGAYQRTNRGSYDLWVALVDPNLDLPPDQQLVWSTLIGGTGNDVLYGLRLDPDGGIWIVGQTFTGFPTTTGAFQPAAGGQSDGFIAKLNPSLEGQDQLVYSTRIGGAGWEWAEHMAVSPSGTVAVIGTCDSMPFIAITKGALQESFAGSSDAFLVVLRPDPALGRDQLLYSTFLGGAGHELVNDVAFSPAGGVVIAGGTASAEMAAFPGVATNGTNEAFVLSVDMRLPEASFTATATGSGSFMVDASASVTPAGTELNSFAWEFGDGTTAEGMAVEHAYTSAGRFAVRLTITNDIGLSSTTTRTVAVACPAGEVAPWTAVEIGSPSFSGGCRRDGDCLSLCAGGKGILSSGDECHFVYREAAGDLVLTARIEELSGGVSGAFAGLMFRESLDPVARFGALLLQEGRARFRTRPSLVRTSSTEDIPLWVRLERRGDELIGSLSTDGCAWTEVGRNAIDGFPETMLVGIAAAGRDFGNIDSSFQAVEARICVGDPPACSATFRRGDANDDGARDLSDALAILGDLFLGVPMNDCEDAADVNDDGSLNISDPVNLLGHLFLGAKPPPEPFAECGEDPTADALGCQAFSKCP